MPMQVLDLSDQPRDLTRLRWRFVICSASFYVNAIAWGFISSTGLFEDALKKTYQLTSLKSTLPGSIQIASMSVLSVFASVLTVKYGVRWTTLGGALISTMGSVLAAVIGEYWAFCSFYGLLIGAGEALMLVPAVLAIPSYFHSSRVSLATATAVSGASIGMLGIPFLLQYLLDIYGLRGATLIGSCLWLSVALAGALFGKGVTSMAEEDVETTANTPAAIKTENDIEHSVVSRRRSNELGNGLIHSRRTSLLPTSAHYHQQKHKHVSAHSQQEYQSDKAVLNTTTVYEGLPFNPRNKSRSSVDSSPILMKSHSHRSLNTNALLHNDQNRLSVLAAAHAARTIDNSPYKQMITSQQQRHQRLSTIEPRSSQSAEHFPCKIFSEIYSLLRINIFRILIISMILIWSFDETNFLFLTDLLESSGQSEQRSTLLIAVTGVADLSGQLFFGYLGDVECINLFILWTCTSVIAGLSLSFAPLVASYGIIGLSVLFAIHAFFLAAPNALGNVIMMEVVGMHRYAMAYGFSLLVSGSASLFGYPLLGFLKDKTQSWTIPFALVSGTMIFGGLVTGTIPIYAYYKAKRRKSKDNSMTIQ